MFALKKVNDEKVDVPKLPQVGGSYLGEKLFELYCIIMLLAKKKSGKTLALRKILQKCAGKKTSVVVFCNTYHKDPVWKNIREMLTKMGVPHTGYVSLFTDAGKIRLQQLLDHLKGEEEEGWSSDSENEDDLEDQDMGPRTESKKPRKKREPKAPKFIFVLDDIGDEIRDRAVTQLLKTHRHYKSKVIISTQSLKDITNAARRQVDIWLLFP